MFSEDEITALIDIPEIMKAVKALKKDFIVQEAAMLDISDHDFLSLIMMTPTIDIALADGKISLFEELDLNKLARKMSSGGYLFQSDPVTYAMRFVFKDFEHWKAQFFSVIRICMEASFDKKRLEDLDGSTLTDPVQRFIKDIMNVPWIFVRFLSLLIIDDADVTDKKSISKVEYNKLLDIGKKLQLDHIPVFTSFCKTFNVK